MKVADLYRWGYSQDRDISFLTNVIQCQCGSKAAKMRGLFQLVNSGREVRSHQFDLFRIVVDGRVYGIEVLESPVVVEHWKNIAELA